MLAKYLGLMGRGGEDGLVWGVRRSAEGACGVGARVEDEEW